MQISSAKSTKYTSTLVRREKTFDVKDIIFASDKTFSDLSFVFSIVHEIFQHVRDHIFFYSSIPHYSYVAF